MAKDLRPYVAPTVKSPYHRWPCRDCGQLRPVPHQSIIVRQGLREAVALEWLAIPTQALEKRKSVGCTLRARELVLHNILTELSLSNELELARTHLHGGKGKHKQSSASRARARARTREHTHTHAHTHAHTHTHAHAHAHAHAYAHAHAQARG